MAHNLENYRKELAAALYKGCANVVYMQATDLSDDPPISGSSWKAWNNEHYVNKYHYLIDTGIITIRIGSQREFRFEVDPNINFEYGGIKDVSEYWVEE